MKPAIALSALLLAGCAIFDPPLVINEPIVSSWKIEKPISTPAAGKYGGYWTCSGKSKVPNPPGFRMVIVQAKTPCGDSPACAFPDFNAIFVRSDFTREVQDRMVDHEQLELEGCSHDPKPSNRIVYDLQGNSIDFPVTLPVVRAAQ